MATGTSDLRTVVERESALTILSGGRLCGRCMCPDWLCGGIVMWIIGLRELCLRPSEDVMWTHAFWQCAEMCHAPEVPTVMWALHPQRGEGAVCWTWLQPELEAFIL